MSAARATGQAENEPPYIDAEGMPHQPFDEDIEGVPYTYPTCGMDGEWWPCQTVRQITQTSRADQAQGQTEPSKGDQVT
ncbi:MULTISPECIES: hypothetical protein [unclassified Streptomyces]|uniref:hypothetical protein n=1 Tax=unclassified Streptomyces TaxID=2593676 RepID=UPI00080512D4|nr:MULTISPECIES: hypothetical protein [unclassified Streptomyces]MYR75135.1 hypothetical protein [Streptomyces sp. SID4925]SBU98019.1 hypothetical protein YUMDRAFT_06005 [Streptomyces sp. OspMP-M45]